MATTSVAGVDSVQREPAEPPESRKWLVVLFIAFASLMTLLIVTGETGPGALRDSNPTATHVVDGYPRANPPLLGFEYWPQLWQAIGFGGAAILLIVFGMKSWRARRMHNGLVVTFAAGGMMAFDPLYNWLGYFPTDPRFLHIPHGATPWSDLAPTFEPVFFWPLYMLWLTAPALLAHWVWTKLRDRARRRKGPGTWMQRHPLLSLLLVCKLVTLPLDWGGFRLGILTDAFIFSQAPGPLVSAGHTSQMQLLWEPILFPLTIMATSLLFYRDSEGRTLHGRAARKVRTFVRFPRLTEFVVAWSIIALSYVICLSGMAVLRFTGQADELARPWPYQDTQVYDPDGLYQQSGEPGLKRTGSGDFDLIRPVIPK
ncbi:spirocyclase AveC family protein [Amycolatopsis sp. K13G38]|uniref:Spirocyclase AveC family protein n=1 Tax=Amycolatopsis acididurans TaxID=2724524 RepID=A0ABX1J6T2_9PSEU|nr:spirocyclase AveC family protein [Amycolatopsis acididurans]NKQ55468.1 spirocyclase AveC family protein [Amycolatopsis acididurans]